jgi:hypothetical protein
VQWRKAEEDVYVERPSEWGNPHRTTPRHSVEAVKLYRARHRERLGASLSGPQGAMIIEIRPRTARARGTPRVLPHAFVGLKNWAASRCLAALLRVRRR